MPSVVLHEPHSGASAKVSPELGFNCFQFEAQVAGRTVPVLDADPLFEGGQTRPSRSGIPLLFPFPNRIRQGRFQWDGQQYQLPPHDPSGNAIHGFVLDRPWRISERDTCSVTGTFQLSVDAPDRLALWPCDFVIEVRYTLQAAALHSDICIRNPANVPLPWGFGTHSYFRFPLDRESKAADCLIQAPASEVWELSESLPTGRRVPVTADNDLREGKSLGGLKLDDVMTGVVPHQGMVRCVLMDTRAGLQVTQFTDDSFRELVVFTPPHGRSVCMEPYTCVTDAVNLQAAGLNAGWRALSPGAEWRTRITIEAGLVLA